MVSRSMAGACGAALVMGLLVAGCTPDPGPGPGGSPTPSVSSAAPSPTPTENAQERQQRLDFEAAEKAYRDADAEVNRLGQIGGASKPTKVLLATTVGVYLNAQMEDLKTLKKMGWRTDRPVRVSVSANGGWSPEELTLTACEDASKVALLDSSGKEVAKDRPRRFVQELTVVRSDGRWKVSGAKSKSVKSFDQEVGCDL